MKTRQDKKEKQMKIIIGIVGILVALILGGGVVLYRVNVPQDKEDNELYDVTVRKGDGLAEVTELLEDIGILKQGVLFRYAIILTGNASSIRVGNYELTPSASILETIDILTGGETSVEGSITIKEGLANIEIAEVFANYFVEHSSTSIASEAERVAFRDQFLAEMNNIEKYRAEYDFLSDVPEDGTLEGYLFPDTYRFFKETEPEKVIRKMLDNFDVRFSHDLRVETAASGKNIHEIVTLASVVQREVADEYMKDVAGIFYNRLEFGMNLQSDATVNYVTLKNSPQPTFEDLEVDSRYNTYKYGGLPPGPVSNPGFSALEASVFPADNEYFFFLTKLDTGEAVYAKTGEEHLENKKQFLD